MDEGPLFLLDHILLMGHVGHGLELGLGDVRGSDPVFALPRLPDDQVGQPDEDRGHGSDRWEADDGGHEGGAEQRGPIGIVHGPVLGHRLEEDEDHHHLEDGADQDADATQEVLGHHADQRGRDQLADEDQEQDRVEELGRLLDEAGQLAGAPALLVHQRLGLDPVHAHQAGLGHGQDARGEQQDGDDDQVHQVGDVEPGGGDQRRTWAR